MDLSFSFAQAVALVACAAALVVAGRGLPVRLTAPFIVVAVASFGWWTGSVTAAAVAAATLCLSNLVGIVGRQLHEAQQAAAPSAVPSGGSVHDAPMPAVVTDRPWPNPHGLTRREIEVLTLVAEGRTNDEIAASLHVSMATVKSHVNRIFTKARVETRAQAVAYAYETSLVAPPTTG